MSSVSTVSSVVKIVTLCVLIACPSFADVGEYLGKPVGSVRLVVEGREATDPVLTGVVRTPIGQPLSMVQVRESVAHLFSLGRFEDVRVDATLDNGRVALRYELTPIHPVTAVRFVGTSGVRGVDAGDLRRAIVDRYGVSPPLGRLADMTRILADELRERGYLHATVAPRADVQHGPERAVLVFTIEPGPRTVIGAVEIVGRPAIARSEFLSRLGLSPGAPYQRDALNARIDRHIQERRAGGYYEAKIVPQVVLADGDRVANVTLTIAPGPRVRVVFAGDPLPADKRDELVPVQREGSVDEDLLEDASNRIEEFLRAQGYRDAAAPHTRVASDGDLVVTFTVRRGQQSRVATYEISGNASLPLAEFAPALRVREREPFSSAMLDADVTLIEELYHRRGFAAARAESAVEIVTATQSPAQVPVAVRIVVNEGVRTVVDGVTFSGNEAVDEATLRGKTGLQPGAPFVPGLLAVDRDAIQLLYQDLGYESATVDVVSQFSDNDTHVTVQFTIQEGPRIFVDHVLIVGNVRTSTSTIERELQVKPGSPFSLAAINESQRRLTALGLFRRARITELRHGDETTRDLLVTVEEAPPTSIGVGGGLEGGLRLVRREEDQGVAAERFEVAPRAFFQIGRRNVFGKNRSVNLFTSVTLRPKDSPVFAGQAAPPSSGGYGFTEYRVIGTFREPHVLNTTADAYVTGTLEQQVRSTFNFARRSASAVVARHLTRDVSVTGNYQIQRTRVFDIKIDTPDQPLIFRTFSIYRISSFSASVIRDTRNDTADPASGRYFSANGELAAASIGSEAGFTKSFFTAQTFTTVPRTNRIVFAGSARIGLGFPRTAVRKDEHGQTIVGPDGNDLVDRVDDLPASERFFAGGDTTVRGFALDKLGAIRDGAPIGGNAVVILNAETRVPVRGGIGVVGFLDSGNVFGRASAIELGALRSAAGFGLRYKSPIGPLRVDLGFKLRRESGEGLTAIHISFGQAF